ncbi:MAG TPA: PLDc N-terminal domain-containing protein [Acidimicrobiia bacterium]|nr:PLDc N-terminal domain-containing protein [Acidimicrobiia bacterium]
MIRGSELLVIVALVVPTVWALVDALRAGETVWQASDQSQTVWMLVILLAPVLGPILYLTLARPRLRAS